MEEGFREFPCIRRLVGGVQAVLHSIVQLRVKHLQKYNSLILLPVTQPRNSPTGQLFGRPHRGAILSAIWSLRGGRIGIYRNHGARAEIADGALHVISTRNVCGEVGVGLLVGGKRRKGGLRSLRSRHPGLFGVALRPGICGGLQYTQGLVGEY
jgi:hypothetical protein